MEWKFCTCLVCNREVSPVDGVTGKEQIITGIIEFHKEMQDKEQYPNCPRCGLELAERNALSRQFDIHICPDCGTDEAARATIGDVLPDEEWWIVREIYKLQKL